MWNKKKEDPFKKDFNKQLKDEDSKLLDEKLSLELPRMYADAWATNLGILPDDQISLMETAIENLVKIDWSDLATVEFYRSDKRIITTDSDGKSMELVTGELISKQSS